VLARPRAQSSTPPVRGDLPAKRGVKRPERDVLIVREERPRAYLEALAALIGSVTGEDVSVASDYRIAMPLTVLDQFDLSKNLSDSSYLGVWSSVSAKR